jgi:hypothetical protein
METQNDLSKKYLTKPVTVDHQIYDSQTYNMLFEKIQTIEEELTLSKYASRRDTWKYKEILKRERRGNSSVYYVLFKKV